MCVFVHNTSLMLLKLARVQKPHKVKVIPKGVSDTAPTQTAVHAVKLSPPEDYIVICVTHSCLSACDDLKATCSLILFSSLLCRLCAADHRPNRSDFVLLMCLLLHHLSLFVPGF